MLNQPIVESTKAEPEPLCCKVTPMDFNPELTNQPMNHCYKSPVVTLIFELLISRGSMIGNNRTIITALHTVVVNKTSG